MEKFHWADPGYLYFVPAMHSANPPESTARDMRIRHGVHGAMRIGRVGNSVPDLNAATGFQKIAQVLSDSTASRHCRRSALTKIGRLFGQPARCREALGGHEILALSRRAPSSDYASDSSAGIRRSGIFCPALWTGTSANQQALAAAFANTNPSEAATLSMAANATTAHLVAHRILGSRVSEQPSKSSCERLKDRSTSLSLRAMLRHSC